MSWGPRFGPRKPDKYISPIPRGGEQARVAAGIMARYGYWPADFLDIVARCNRGVIPDYVKQLRDRLSRERPWERCAHGTDLTVEPCLECIQ